MIESLKSDPLTPAPEWKTVRAQGCRSLLIDRTAAVQDIPDLRHSNLNRGEWPKDVQAPGSRRYGIDLHFPIPAIRAERRLGGINGNPQANRTQSEIDPDHEGAAKFV